MKDKEREFYKIPEDDLSNYAAEALLTPFANKNSTPRLAMFKSALGHSVAPNKDPDRPLVDSKYSANLVISSDNYKSKGLVTLLNRIDKYVHGIHTESTFFYYDHGTDKVEIEVVPEYERFYKFGYRIKSELSDMQINETSSEPMYTRYTFNMDPNDGYMNYGRNVKFVYSSSKDVGEDSITITKDLANRMALDFMDEVEIIYSPESHILKNLYGTYDENGNAIYKPFPNVGEELTREVVFAVTDMNENSYLAINEEVNDSDNAKYVHKGAIVYDLTVYSNEILKNEFLEELRKSQMDYIRQISVAISKIMMSPFAEKLSDDLKYKSDRYKSILNGNLRVGKVSLRNKVYIKMKTVIHRPLDIGDKITNRDGGKGTVGKIVDHITVGGKKADALINLTGTINRENAGQFFEKEINTLNERVQEYLIISDDSLDIKYSNLIKFIDLANQGDLIKDILYLQNNENVSIKDIVEYFSYNFIRFKFNPYGQDMTFKRFYELTRLVTSFAGELKGEGVEIDGNKFSDLHFAGTSFYLVQEKGTIEDDSIRADGIANIKGALSKKGASRKRHQAKWGTVAAKLSDLGLSILLNYAKTEDRPLLNNNIKILDDYMLGLGIKLELKEKKLK